MKTIGNALASCLVLWLLLFTQASTGAVTANIDRNRVALGDSVRLTLTATDDEDIDDSDLRPLLADFEIMQRSTSSNTTIINGRISQSRQVIVDLSPLHEGDLVIPALHVGSSVTQALTVSVSPASSQPADGERILFEAEVDQPRVYVQGQVILTLRLQTAVNLEAPSLPALQLDNAFVKPLEQHSFQRTINGQPWIVAEIRYAIFPEQSGSLDIPAQTFTGRLNEGRRGFFGHGGGQRVRRSTTPITLEVLPKPDTFGPTDWLPARKLSLKESWSTPPEQLRVGESATRTIEITGEGLQGAQLPPILFAPIDGLKYYPDQPQITEQEVASGLQGVRRDSTAVVPTRAGTYEIPEIRIPWWDVQQEKLQYAVLPARHITVAAGAMAPAGTVQPAPVPAANSTPVAADNAPPTASNWDTRVWPALAGLSTVGWLLTLVYLWRQRQPRRRDTSTPPGDDDARTALKQLLNACAAQDATAARAAVIRWATALKPGHGIVSLDQVSSAFGDTALARELTALNASLYSTGDSRWTGDALAECARRLQSTHRRTPSVSGAGQLALYPQAN